MQLIDFLTAALQKHGSDIFMIPGSQVMVKVSGQMIPLTEEKILPNHAEQLISEIYQIARREKTVL